MDDKKKLISLEGLSAFKDKMDTEIDEKIAQGGGGVSPEQKAIWDAKYDKPEGGIPKTDLASAIQTSLGKADTALQSFTEEDPTVPSHVKSITETNITSWNEKQDKLTAGSNITIEGNVISATGGGVSGNFVESIDGGSRNIDELWELVRHTHGAHGSVSLVKKESGVGSDIPGGWYNFYHSPHRSGGDSGDNKDYGTIILTPMTDSINSWIVRCTGGNVAEAKVIIDSGNIRSQSVGSADQAYKLITTSDHSQYADLSWLNDLERYYLKVKAADGTDRNVAVDYASQTGWAATAAAAGNADTVDGIHAWNLMTLNADGGGHGESYTMYCRYNILGDDHFYIGVNNGYERKVAVAYAEGVGYYQSTQPSGVPVGTVWIG